MQSTASVSEVVELSLTISEKLKEWIVNSKSLSILVAGRAGTGKSTLVNALVGKKVAKVGHKLTPETSKVQCHEVKVGKITVQMIDSPGLQHGMADEERYLSQIKEKCSNADIFLYCIKMSETRLYTGCSDGIALQRLNKVLGAQLWENGLIVLTFGNDLIGMAKAKGEKFSAYFQGQYKKLSTMIREFLCEQVKIEQGVADDIPIVCAGYVSEPLLPSISHKDLTGSRDREIHWLSYLWLKALYRTKQKAQPAMIKLNEHRLSREKDFSSEELLEAARELIELQPILLRQQGIKFGEEFGEVGKDVGSKVGELFTGKQKSVEGLSHALMKKLALDQGIITESDV